MALIAKEITQSDWSSMSNDFDSVYESSLSAMNSGNFDWGIFERFRENNAEGKKAFIKEVFDNIHSKANGKLWAVVVDDKVVSLGCGQIDGSTIVQTHSLIGTDVDGSKSWLYHNDRFPQLAALFTSFSCNKYKTLMVTAGTMPGHITSSMEHRKTQANTEKVAKWDASTWTDETEKYIKDDILGDPSFDHTTNIKTFTLDI